MVLLAHQLARGVAGEDQYGVPRRLALFQLRLTPFGSRGAAVLRQTARGVILNPTSIISLKINKKLALILFFLKLHNFKNRIFLCRNKIIYFFRIT
ncbi:hypothetical protein C3E80_21085 [Cronobacter malonaticus]|uniref:Uncharacterized protein n=1 Tax=Cronobacter malonaticus TaxID=413503 RepID=A0A423XQ75_9ENTR|nr:hypothetical protein C3E80_21085 [Cronobacter malonaticus]